MKAKIRLDTHTDALEFSRICEKLEGKIVVTDSNGLCVNAKSVLGMLYALEFDNLWCESQYDIYRNIEAFITEE